MKRCLTIQDYSCLGRCSLTVALPILSSQGIETVGLPTAVLSNHTAFKKFNYVDLTSYMLENVRMWDQANLSFDCVYTGYLGKGQAAIVGKIIEKYKKEDTLVFVDPAFGDNGKLYAGFDESHVDEMRELLKYASIIVPNKTEACHLLKIPYQGEEMMKEEAEKITKALSKMGPEKVVVTGVLLDENQAGCAIYDAKTEKLSFYSTENLPGKYHGAGDSFASAMIGCLLNGLDLEQSVKIAHDFVHKSMQENLRNGVDGILYGLCFEGELHFLYQWMMEEKNRK